MRDGLLALALASMVAAVPLHAEPVPVASTPVTSRWDELAGVMLDSENLDATVDHLVPAMVAELAKNPEFAGLEKDYPGLIDAFGVALRPIIQTEMERRTPQYRTELAALYAQNLTADEALQVIRFMQGPAMRRFNEHVRQNRTVTALMKDVTEDRDVSAMSIESDIQATSAGAVNRMPPEDIKVIRAFYQAPLGAKLKVIHARKMAIRQRWANQASPAYQAQTQRAVVDALIAHIDKSDPAMAAALRDLDRQGTGAGGSVSANPA
jgi:hypothetical protein